MSLGYPIGNVRDLAHAFAAKDEFISALSSHIFEENYVMKPTDDYYVAPYCFMRIKDRLRFNSCVGFLIFSSMVPFCEKHEHRVAKEQVKKFGYHKRTFLLGTIESIQETLKLNESSIYTFTSEGCVPTAEEVTQELEDTAISVVCDLMRWRFPVDWRQRRESVAYVFGPVYELQHYSRGDEQQHKKQQERHHQPQPNQHIKRIVAEEHASDYLKNAEDEQEEKKEATLLDYLPLPTLVQTPTRGKSDGLLTDSFYDRNADNMFGGTFNPYTSRYYQSSVEDDEQSDDGNTFISSYNRLDDDDDLFGI